VSPDSPSRARALVRALPLALLALAPLTACAAHPTGPRARPAAFYTPPRHLPARPGEPVRAEALSGAALPRGTRGWRLLYTTTRADGAPAVTSGIVVVPTGRRGPLPVVVWAHGTTGVAAACAPSLRPDPYGIAAPVLDAAAARGWAVVARGWAVVAPDYPGLGVRGPSPYLVGRGEGRAVLDAVRAARRLPARFGAGARLSPRTVVWGHSQGGNAALWAGVLAPAYAPGLRLAGVAAVSPVADLTAFAARLGHARDHGGAFAAYLLDAYGRAYPDVRPAAYTGPGGRAALRAAVARCLRRDRGTVHGMLGRDPLTGPLARRLRENAPVHRIDAPVLLTVGGADPVVPPATQARYVHRMCALGQRGLEYRVYPGLGHDGVLRAGSPLPRALLAWTRARLAGDRPESSGACLLRVRSKVLGWRP
jgi:pimeloyl-ACP methyl ester carboxylesterase